MISKGSRETENWLLYKMENKNIISHQICSLFARWKLARRHHYCFIGYIYNNKIIKTNQTTTFYLNVAFTEMRQTMHINIFVVAILFP